MSVEIGKLGNWKFWIIKIVNFHFLLSNLILKLLLFARVKICVKLLMKFLNFIQKSSGYLFKSENCIYFFS